MQLTDMVSTIKEIGLPAASVLLALYIAIVSLKWLGSQVIKPLAERHINYLDQASDTLASVAAVVTKILENQLEWKQDGTRLVRALEKVDVLDKRTEDHGAKLTEIHSMIRNGKS